MNPTEDLLGREFHHARSEARALFPRLEVRFDAPAQRQHLDVFLFAGGDVIQLDLRFTVIAQSKPTFSRAEMVTVWWLKLTHAKGVKYRGVNLTRADRSEWSDDSPDGGLNFFNRADGVDDFDALRIFSGDGIVTFGDALEKRAIRFLHAITDERHG